MLLDFKKVVVYSIFYEMRFGYLATYRSIELDGEDSIAVAVVANFCAFLVMAHYQLPGTRTHNQQTIMILVLSNTIYK